MGWIGDIAQAYTAYQLIKGFSGIMLILLAVVVLAVFLWKVKFPKENGVSFRKIVYGWVMVLISAAFITGILITVDLIEPDQTKTNSSPAPSTQMEEDPSNRY